MRRIYLFWAMMMVCCVSANAQQTLFNFEESQLNATYWSESNNAISLSNEHTRYGAQSMKWEMSNDAKLSFNYSDYGYLSSDRIMYIPIFCSAPSNDKLRITLYYGSTKLAEATHDLNYQGWLPFQRYIRTDFDKDVTTYFNRVEITYLPETISKSQTVWIDEVCSAANNYYATNNNIYYECVLGPQAVTDYKAGYFPTSRENLNPYFMEAFIHIKGVDDTFVLNAANIAEVDDLLAKYTNVTVTASKTLAAANAYVVARNIIELPDGSVNATPESVVYTPAQAALCGDYITTLVCDAVNNKNQTSKEYLLNLTKYMLDYGMAPGGGEVGMQPSNYTTSRDFAKGFLRAMPIYEEYDNLHPSANLKQRVIDLLKWCYNYGYIYGDHRSDLLTLDQVHVKLWAYYNIAALYPTVGERANELKLITRFLERMSQIESGTEGVIRPDGIGFHHNAMHNSYMYGFQSWIGHATNMKGTSFRVGLSAFENVRYFASTLYKQCVSNGASSFYSNAQCGRGAFNMVAGINQSGLEQLAYLGGDIQGTLYDKQTAAICKYFYPASSFNETPNALEGFHQMNYGNMGVYRNKNYAVTMRGLSANFWGTEIYSNANRFGRYQSYGTTEVLYNNEGYAGNGYPTNKGWDWNVVPGTTTVHTSWKELNAGGHEAISRLSRADEYQTNNFAGSLAAGNCGVFALDFEENAKNTWGGPINRYTPSHLKFKKTVFAIDGKLICLGSNIEISNNVGIRTATNLFQNILSPSVGSLYINSETPATNMDKDITENVTNWMVTPAGTGYYIPQNTGTLHVMMGEQSTPNTDINFYIAPASFPMITTQVAKSWITHNSVMGGEKYEFVIVPQVSPTEMKTIAADLAKSATYNVLQQDNYAHIVKHPATLTTAYSIFDAQTDFKSLNELVTEVDNPCLIITKQKDNNVELNVCSPDALDTRSVTINVKGKWAINNLSTNVTYLVDSSSETPITSVKIKQQDGLSTTVQLVPSGTNTAVTSTHSSQMNVSVGEQQKELVVRFTDQQENLSLQVYNHSGVQLWSAKDLKESGEGIPINASLFPSGLYLVKATNGLGESFTKKFILP